MTTYPSQIRCRAVAAVTRLYPFKSGCGTLANSQLLTFIARPSERDVWAKVEGGNALVPLQDYVGSAMYFFGDLDPKISWVIDRCVCSGDVALDIGANLGLVSLRLAARVGQGGQVHAFEPNPHMVYYLSETLRQNNSLPIIIHPIALGSENRHSRLAVPLKNAGAATFVENTKDSKATIIDVSVRRLSDYGTEIGLDRVDFVKIDVEGFEQEVFKGAIELFERTKPKVVVFEEHKAGQTREWPGSLTAISSLGYDIFGLPRKLTSVRLTRVSKGGDLAAFHDYVAISRLGTDEIRSRLGI